MKSFRRGSLFCICFALLAAANFAPAQQSSAPVIGDAAKQKLRTARFLSERGIAAHSGRSGAKMMSAARSHPSVLALPVARSAHETGAVAHVISLTAAWQPVGPAQVSTAAYGLVTGRATSLAADPSDATGNTLYVGSTGGGVWKSTNAAGAGATFTPLTDTLSVFAAPMPASLSIGALSVQPGGTGVVLAGTGDPNDATDSYYGAGILRSTDGGVTWSLITQSTDSSGGTFAHFTFLGNSFAGFAWSTASPHTVVAAVTSAAETPAQESVVNAGSDKRNIRGLFYSQDDGQTWHLATITDGDGSMVQSFQTTFDGPGNAATAVVWNPVRQMFYAAVRFHGYYQSPDGTSWTRLANQPGAGLIASNCPSEEGQTIPLSSTSCPIFRGALAVQPVTGDLFALTVDVNNVDQGLWQDVCALSAGVCSSPGVMFANQIADAAIESGSGDGTIPQADYDLYLAAMPSSQDTLLFVGTEDVYRCSLTSGCVWRNTTQSTGCMSARVAPAQHAIDASFASRGILYFGNDGGLWASSDLVNELGMPCSVNDASHYQNLNGGLGSLAEVESLAQDPGSAEGMMTSLGALGTAAAQGTATAWALVLGGEGNDAAIDPANDDNWYATSVFGVGINRCTEGASCNEAGFGAPVIDDAQLDNDAQVIPAPWILDPMDTANLLLGTCRVWRGPGSGSWSDANLLSQALDGGVGPQCNGNAEIRTLAALSNGNASEQVYAGMAGPYDGGGSVAGHVFTASVSNRAGQTAVWSDLSSSPVANQSSSGGLFNPGGFDISSIFVDPHDPTGETIYVTAQGFSGNGIDGATVYASTDGGAQWMDIGNNLPNVPANSVVVDPNDANVVYVATDIGVFVTVNVANCTNANDDCWSFFGTGLPNAPAIQLATSNTGSAMLRAATYGRGIWQIPLVTAGTVFTTATANPAALSFSSQQEETESAPQQVTVNNTGSAALTVSGVTASGDFSETDNCVTAPIASGGSCMVNVSFTPTRTGTRTGVLTIFGNVPGGQLTVALSGVAAAPPSIVLTPLQLSFGATPIGQSAAVQDVTISNTGTATAALASETVSGDFAITANTCGSSLAANYGCTISIGFTPTASGSRTGSLTVVDSAGTQTTQLSGIGQAPATDTLSPSSLTFGAQVIGTSSQAQQVTLTNTGDSALQLIATQVSGDFSVVNTCGPSLPGHSTCAISVQYVPAMTGAESGTLTVSDKMRSQTVGLSGTGLAPAGISATPATVDFGNYAVGGSSPAQTVTLTDNGGIGLTNVSYAITGDFSLPASAGGCGSSLAAGANCPIAVIFSPTQAGVRSGMLTVTADGLTAPLVVMLSGNGEDFALQVSGSPSATVTSGQAATYQLQILPISNSTGSVSLACSGAPQYSTCTLNPASLTLSGSATASATVTVATGLSAASASLSRWERFRSSGRMLALAIPVSLLFLWRRNWRRAVMLSASLLLFTVFAIGCGLGASAGSANASSAGTNTSTNTTPSGTYTITVTATAPGLSHSVQLTLIVE